MDPLFAFFILGITIILGTWQGIRKYGTALNPLTFIMLTESLTFMLFSGLVANYLVRPMWLTNKYEEGWVTYTALLCVLNLIGTMAAFVIPTGGLVRAYGRVLSILRLNSAGTASTYQPQRFWILIGLAMVMLLCVAVFGGGGMLWLTNPREAYMEKRQGVISFFMISQWILMAALLYYLWAKKPRGKSLIWTTLGFAILCIFTGSKSNIFVNVIVAAVYYNYRVKRLPNWVVPVCLCLAPFVMICNIYAYGGYNDLLQASAFFQDYFDSTAWYLSKFHNQFRYGGSELSYLWYFAPRPLFPDKPYDWGDRVVDVTLYPGAAEQGYTPASLGWTTSYIDFGIIGVFLAGVMTGLIRRIAYEYFLRRRDSFFAFVLCVQLALAHIFVETDVLGVTVMIVVALALYLRISFRWHGRRGSMLPAQVVGNNPLTS